MKLAIIAAMDKFQTIGNQNKLPWHLSADLQYFKKLTLGKPIIMGRRTYESIGRVLPQRQNIVITRNPNLKLTDKIPNESSLVIVNSLDSALAAIQKDITEAMIIGGAMLFQEALPKVQTLYLTYIHAAFKGDAFFPEIDPMEWQEIWREDHQKNTENPYDYSFVKLVRKNSIVSA